MFTAEELKELRDILKSSNECCPFQTRECHSCVAGMVSTMRKLHDYEWSYDTCNTTKVKAMLKSYEEWIAGLIVK